MRFVDIFAGIGGFRHGLQQAGHTAVAHIEWDKYANASYMAMYDLVTCKYEDDLKGNCYKMCKMEVQNECNAGTSTQHCKGEWYGKDIKSVASGEIPEAEIWTFGFPCTDISISNSQQRGLDGSRSGLFFEVTRLLKGKNPENRPQFIIAENVKNLLSIKGGRDFTTILSEISALGYSLQWQVVNSKNFNVPQNRERVYIVGHLGNGSPREIFPIGRTNSATLTQIRGGSQGERIYNSTGLSNTLTALGGGFAGKCGLYTVSFNRNEGIRKEIEVAHAFCATDGQGLNRNQNQTAILHANQCVSFIDYNEDGQLTEVARCVTARQNAGMRNHVGEASAVLLCGGNPDCVRAVITPDREEKRQNGRRIKEEGEPSFTLTCQDKHGVMLCCCHNRCDGFPIREAKKDGFTMAYEGDGVNLSYPNSTVSRGRVGKKCAQTLVTGGSMGVVNCCRIRRLTPKECFRLQAFDDGLFEKTKAIGTSDAQLYKQAGNAVTASVVYEIGKKLKKFETMEGLNEI